MPSIICLDFDSCTKCFTIMTNLALCLVNMMCFWISERVVLWLPANHLACSHSLCSWHLILVTCWCTVRLPFMIVCRQQIQTSVGSTYLLCTTLRRNYSPNLNNFTYDIVILPSANCLDVAIGMWLNTCDEIVPIQGTSVHFADRIWP